MLGPFDCWACHHLSSRHRGKDGMGQAQGHQAGRLDWDHAADIAKTTGRRLDDHENYMDDLEHWKHQRSESAAI